MPRAMKNRTLRPIPRARMQLRLPLAPTKRRVRVTAEVAGVVVAKARITGKEGAARGTEEDVGGGASVVRTAGPIARTATAKMMAATSRSNWRVWTSPRSSC